MGEREGGACSFQEKAKNVKIYSIALLHQAKDLYSFFLISFFFFFFSPSAFGHFPFSWPPGLLCPGCLTKPRATFSYCVFQDGIFSLSTSLSVLFLQPVYKSQTHIPVSARELVHLLTLQH